MNDDITVMACGTESNVWHITMAVRRYARAGLKSWLGINGAGAAAGCTQT